MFENIDIVDTRQTILSMSKYFLVLSSKKPTSKVPMSPIMMNKIPTAEIYPAVYSYGSKSGLRISPRLEYTPKRDMKMSTMRQ